MPGVAELCTPLHVANSLVPRSYSDLLLESRFVRLLAATLAFCLPAFSASLIFVESFSKGQFEATARGSNLFGALAGGLLESLTLWFGLRSFTLLAALFYVASALTILDVQRLSKLNQTAN